MSKHFADPRHGEPCPDCNGTGLVPKLMEWEQLTDRPVCPTCKGTGKRGGDAEPCINVQPGPEQNWFAYWPFREDELHFTGPHSTATDALFAARCVIAAAEIEPSEGYDGEWMVKLDGEWTEPYPTREAALIAALDAQEGRARGEGSR